MKINHKKHTKHNKFEIETPMKETIFFTEKQRFNQWWIWFLLIGGNGIVAFLLIRQVALRQSVDSMHASNSDLVVALVVMLLVTVAFFFIQLKTVISDKGIYVQLFPFQIRYTLIPWENVKRSYVRQYKPLAEYGGWGYRVRTKKNIAYNISGNVGLQLELINEKKILIGTLRSDEVQGVLEKIKAESRIEQKV